MNQAKKIFWLSLCFLLVACTQPATEQTPTTIAAVSVTDIAAATPTPLPTSPATLPSATLPATPSPRPLPPAQATATPDPARSDWTLLFYQTADYNFAPDPLAVLTALSKALPGNQVQILAQLDRHPSNATDGLADARRYRLQPGNPELLASLGEINMVDGEQFADFLTWGLQTAPANQYALILSGPGSGWAGFGLDETAPDDHLSLVELGAALTESRQTTGLDLFDLVLFDGSLMAQVEVLQTLQPHAGYMVASAGLTQPLAYDPFLTLFATESAQDAAAIAAATVSQMVVSHDPGASWVAIDMARVPDLTHAVELLASSLLTDPARHATTASIARRNSETYTWLSPQEADPIAALDAWNFANLLSQLSEDAGLVAAATNLMAAVRTALLAEQHGPAYLWARGIALTFPPNSTTFNPAYVTQTPIPAWADWLRAYHQVWQKTALPPAINLEQPTDDPLINWQNPLFLGVEIAGIDLEQVDLISGRYDRTGRRQLLEFTPYVPKPQSLGDGRAIYSWRDGLNETLLVWPAELPYLADSRRGDWVLTWPVGFTAVKAITGQVYPIGQEEGTAAQLLWDQTSGTILGLWLVQSGMPYPLILTEGLAFRPDNWYLEFQGQMTSQPGRELVLAELTVQKNALADGEYFVGLAAANSPGERHQMTSDVHVASSELFAGYQVYIDPGFGFQFLYPTGWQRPVLDGDVCQTEALTLCTFSPDLQTALHVIFYPDAGPRNATMLRDEAVAAFNGVDVLYQVEQTMAGQQAQYTIYGYAAPDGDHVGVLLTFVHEGIGYVIDLDGPAAQQVITLDIADKLIRSWQFQPLLIHSFPGGWLELTTDSFQVNYPATFVYSSQENGWHQWDVGVGTFMAVRVDAAAGRSADSILRSWLAATSNKTEFQAIAPYRQLLGKYSWQRTDFTWITDDGSQVTGFIMVTVVNDQAIIAWAEAPTIYYSHIERATFRIILADLTLAD
ncbi:MAG: hypothetical protein KA314_30185 [Chloroflexi bacterium]|nr:hypothetical protein [Chloroflexota bacterium]